MPLPASSPLRDRRRAGSCPPLLQIRAVCLPPIRRRATSSEAEHGSGRVRHHVHRLHRAPGPETTSKISIGTMDFAKMAAPSQKNGVCGWPWKFAQRSSPSPAPWLPSVPRHRRLRPRWRRPGALGRSLEEDGAGGGAAPLRRHLHRDAPGRCFGPSLRLPLPAWSSEGMDVVAGVLARFGSPLRARGRSWRRQGYQLPPAQPRAAAARGRPSTATGEGRSSWASATGAGAPSGCRAGGRRSRPVRRCRRRRGWAQALGRQCQSRKWRAIRHDSGAGVVPRLEYP